MSSQSAEIVTPKAELAQATQDDFDLTDSVEDALMKGDLSGLESDERKEYYDAVCKSLGLNPLTQPFDYIEFKRNGQTRLQLYATRDCAEQLRKIHNVSIINLEEKRLGDKLYRVKAKAEDEHGRIDQASGVVPINGKPSYLADQMMKAETKAKRRVTLSICGLGFVDESEVEDTQELDHTAVEKQTEKIAEKAADKTNVTNGDAVESDSDKNGEEENKGSIDPVINSLLDEFNKQTLKEACRQKDLKVSGDKPEIAERLAMNGVNPSEIHGYFDDEDESETDAEEQVKGNGEPVKMFEIMERTREQLDEIEEAMFNHVKATVDEYGQSEDVVSDLEDYLDACLENPEDYETDDNGVIAFR